MCCFKMAKRISNWEKVLIAIIIGLSLLDLFSNILSLIPAVGGVLETFSETVFELLTILSAILLALRD